MLDNVSTLQCEIDRTLSASHSSHRSLISQTLADHCFKHRDHRARVVVILTCVPTATELHKIAQKVLVADVMDRDDDAALQQAVISLRKVRVHDDDAIDARFNAVNVGHDAAAENRAEKGAQVEYGEYPSENMKQQSAIDDFDEEGQSFRDAADNLFYAVKMSYGYSEVDINFVKIYTDKYEEHLHD